MPSLAVFKALLLIPLTLALELMIEATVFLWRKLFPAKAPGHAVPGTKTSKHTAIYRHFDQPNGVLHRPQNAPRNLLEAFQATVKKHPRGHCMGVRAAGLDGRVAGDFVWQTYEQCAERMRHFSAGLEYLDMLQLNEEGLKLLALFAKNRPECIIAEYVSVVL